MKSFRFKLRKKEEQQCNNFFLLLHTKEMFSNIKTLSACFLQAELFCVI